ncbi:MAG TPA: radical SAM protein [Candidatus Acidoferrum sp.]|jgi:hypothetical protein|nr:radical SAM protein [Candidatus Acidoferrum sp.]
MMRFPALLTAKLAKARIKRVFRPAHQGRLLAFADPAEILHAGSAHPVSHEKIRDAIGNPAPVIWVGGGEPLDHPGIAHFIRAIAPSGHYIFLETNGALLRRRIHELQPLPRVFLTVRLDAVRTPQSDLAAEGLRAAWLSGFFTVVHSVVCEDSNLAGLDRLRGLLLEMDVDGWLITAGSTSAEVVRKASEARTLVPSAAWRRFSEQVEHELLTPSAPLREKPPGENCEEGVKVA